MRQAANEAESEKSQLYKQSMQDLNADLSQVQAELMEKMLEVKALQNENAVLRASAEAEADVPSSLNDNLIRTVTQGADVPLDEDVMAAMAEIEASSRDEPPLSPLSPKSKARTVESSGPTERELQLEKKLKKVQQRALEEQVVAPSLSIYLSVYSYTYIIYLYIYIYIVYIYVYIYIHRYTYTHTHTHTHTH